MGGQTGRKARPVVTSWRDDPQVVAIRERVERVRGRRGAELARPADLRGQVRAALSAWWQREYDEQERRRATAANAAHFDALLTSLDRALTAVSEEIDRPDTLFGDRRRARRLCAALQGEAERWRATYAHLADPVRRHALTPGGRPPAPWASLVPLAETHGYQEVAEALTDVARDLHPDLQRRLNPRGHRVRATLVQRFRANLRRHK